MPGLLLWVLMPAAVVGVVAFRVVKRGRELRQILLDGVAATGTVRTKVAFHGSGARSRYLRYDYRDAAGRTHSHRSLVPRDVWNAHEKGGPIAIVYSASRPQISAPQYLVDLGRRAMEGKADAGARS